MQFGMWIYQRDQTLLLDCWPRVLPCCRFAVEQSALPDLAHLHDQWQLLAVGLKLLAEGQVAVVALVQHGVQAVDTVAQQQPLQGQQVTVLAVQGIGCTPPGGSRLQGFKT